MTKTYDQIATDIRAFVSSAYPEMEVKVGAFDLDPNRTAVFFVEEKFKLLYPMQRYHYLAHLIPTEYQDQHLQNSAWFELAPSENPDDLEFPDEELIKSITPNVLRSLGKTRFFAQLDDRMCPQEEFLVGMACRGDFQLSRAILPLAGYAKNEHFDIFHVLMSQGAYCDCEILFNVAPESRLRTRYWKARAKDRHHQA